METISPYIFPFLKLSFLDKQKYLNLKKPSKFTCEDVKEVIANRLEISNDFLVEKTRKTEYVDARKIYCKICVDFLGMKSVQVAKTVLGYDHTSVLYSKHKFDVFYETSEVFRQKSDKVLDFLQINNLKQENNGNRNLY